MKKVLSLAAVLLLFATVLFTACRDNTSQGQTQTEEAAPAAPQDEQTAPAEDAPQEAALEGTEEQKEQ